MSKRGRQHHHSEDCDQNQTQYPGGSIKNSRREGAHQGGYRKDLRKCKKAENVGEERREQQENPDSHPGHEEQPTTAG